MKELLLVVNPCAGVKKARRYLMDIIEIFNRAGYAVTVHITAAPGDGEAAVLCHAHTAERIVCCGGDGTFNEVVSGLFKSGINLPLGYLPAGSTNDFATSLGLPADLRKAAHIAAAGTPLTLDIGCFGGRYFSYVASFGLFTKASYTTPQSMKNSLGHAAYVLSGIQELSQLKTYPLRFTLPDGTVVEDSFIFGAISNSTSVGGILTLDGSQVDMADGLMELLLIRAPKSLIELSECVWALQQKDYSHSMLTFLNTASLTVHAPADMPWTLDGELEPGHSQVDVQCIRHGITVLTPEDRGA